MQWSSGVDRLLSNSKQNCLLFLFILNQMLKTSPVIERGSLLIISRSPRNLWIKFRWSISFWNHIQNFLLYVHFSRGILYSFHHILKEIYRPKLIKNHWSMNFFNVKIINFFGTVLMFLYSSFVFEILCIKQIIKLLIYARCW